MGRIVHVASAQMGPISRSETRKDSVRRLIALMREAKGRGAELVVFPELALTTFFPRWLIEDEAELDGYYERKMPGPDTIPLFDEAKSLGVGFYLGYAELAIEDGRKRRFNNSMAMFSTRSPLLGMGTGYLGSKSAKCASWSVNLWRSRSLERISR